ncbi:11021_t:CDS:10 [Funneliformis caledonium]|uniref:11021_t:CDS:1 n=1 Tax=Funneliformis caledonium TaxID=1117310 RepID=A0A9N9BFD0_9GLOM|nr:11021_t:CDS:10 [Funneliformis caledonium]
MSFTSVEGKVAFVSAASGIGEAVVTRLVKEGAKVTVADIQDELGKKLVEELNSGKTETVAIYEHVDVTNWNEYLAAFKKTVQVYGRVDIIVNNAGIFAEGDCLFDDSDEPPNALKMIDVNLKGVLNGTKLGIRFLKQNGKDGGVIVNTSSIAGLFNSPLVPIYSASKFGVVGLSISVAITVTVHNIRINVIAPSAVDTPMMKSVIHTIPDDHKVEMRKVVDAFIKLFTNPAYNGEIIALYPGGVSAFVEKSIYELPTKLNEGMKQVINKYGDDFRKSNKQTDEASTYRELITEPIALTPKDNRIINHSELPSVKDELSVTLKVNIAAHGPSWATIFHKGGENGRTPSLFLTPNTSHARPRFSITDNYSFGIDSIGDGLLLNRWYHMAYTLSNSERRMDFILMVQKVLFNDAPLYIGNDLVEDAITGQINNFRYYNFRLSQKEVLIDYMGEDPTKSNEIITPSNGTIAPSNGTTVYGYSCPETSGVLAGSIIGSFFCGMIFPSQIGLQF